MNPAPSICSKNYLGNIKQILNKYNIGIIGYIKKLNKGEGAG